jgi:hypothetical protein
MGAGVAAQTDTTTWTNQLRIVDTLYAGGNLGAYPMQDAANAVELCVHDVDPTTGESDLQHLHGYAHLQATTVYRQRAPGGEGTRRAPETLRERGGISARPHSELQHDFAVAQGSDSIKWCHCTRMAWLLVRAPLPAGTRPRSCARWVRTSGRAARGSRRT